jgi:deferrochelatase/peroxidase EfeB
MHDARPEQSTSEADEFRTSFSRRRLLRRGVTGGLTLAAVAGAAPLAMLGPGEASAQEPPAPPPPAAFFGEHQAGIVTRPTARILLATFDLTTSARDDLAGMMQRWTAAAQQLTAQHPGMTFTFAVGSGLFDRLGMQAARPAGLRPLPAFAGDALDDAYTEGDLAVQLGAATDEAAAAALDTLSALGVSVLQVRATQAGFTDVSAGRRPVTPRNLMGFKDGTANPPFMDGITADQHVWVGSEGPSWLQGGSYLVMRRIRLDLAAWESTSTAAQEDVIGRAKASGAPLTGTRERDRADFRERDASGQLVIPVDAHIRRAEPRQNGGARILRRGYNYREDSTSLPGGDAGLLFLSYQRDPAQFIRIQSSLATLDALNRFSKTVGSGLFAALPGAVAGGWIGERLLGT